MVEAEEVSTAHQHVALVRCEAWQPVAAALTHQRGVVTLVHGACKPADAELQRAFCCLLVAALLAQVCCGLGLVPVAVERQADLAALLALEGAPAIYMSDILLSGCNVVLQSSGGRLQPTGPRSAALLDCSERALQAAALLGMTPTYIKLSPPHSAMQVHVCVTYWYIWYVRACAISMWCATLYTSRAGSTVRPGACWPPLSWPSTAPHLLLQQVDRAGQNMFSAKPTADNPSFCP